MGFLSLGFLGIPETVLHLFQEFIKETEEAQSSSFYQS